MTMWTWKMMRKRAMTSREHSVCILSYVGFWSGLEIGNDNNFPSYRAYNERVTAKMRQFFHPSSLATLGLVV